jgi:carbamoyltransferase
MNILGVSGLENAVPFKKEHWPNLSEREYRMVQGQDAAAALVVDGTVVASAAEERFNRRKHSARFPVNAMRFCLDRAGLSIRDIDELAHSFDYSPYRILFGIDPVSSQAYREVYSREALLASVRREFSEFPEDRVRQVDHHLAHAASAYYTSGWNDCLVVVADGMGEMHGVSVYRGAGGKLTSLAKMPALDSIGILYSLVTFHLGFDFNSDEYKIMGLAPYGNPRRFRSFFDDMVEFRPDGTIAIRLLKCDRTRDERENYSASRRFLEEHLLPARDPRGDILDVHRDVAAALQECLDRVMLHICGHFACVANSRHLALAGGLALNCTANGHLRKSGLFQEIYVQPAAGDDGSALGAALQRAAEAGEVRNLRFATPYLGPAYSNDDIAAALEEFRDRIEFTPQSGFEETCAHAAKLIAQGRVVAWYRGAMEHGPRALGHRSILADPGRPEMRDRINAMVKMREAFRPFAPAVSLEQVDRWFDVPPRTQLPYMTMIVDVREDFADRLPAITHVNRSARVQTVSRKDDPEFHALLRAVGRETGREMVLNTSFNVKGQPIVNTPREALYTFLSTGIEFLFLGNVVVNRRTEPAPGDRRILEDSVVSAT